MRTRSGAMPKHWARWRDDDAGEHYWLAADLGKAGLAPAVLPEIAQRLYEQGQLDSFLDLFNHRSAPSKVLTPPRLAGATARLLARDGCDRRAVLGEVGAPHRPGRRAKAPGPASALCPPRDVHARRPDRGRRR